MRLVNRWFGVSLLLLFVALEIVLRTAPDLDPRTFRVLYGNSLSMFMTVRERLAGSIDTIRVLGMGDSLAMTQFQPELFGDATGRSPGQVFNSAYLGMSFPSQGDLLHSVHIDQARHLELVLYFLNPRRLSHLEVPNTDVLRVGVPPAEGVWSAAWSSRKVEPLLNLSRLYGLSRHLLVSSWQTLAQEEPSWDQLEYLGRWGGVAWPDGRPGRPAPRYPYAPLERVSDERISEMETVLASLRDLDVEVWIVPSALHPSVDAFASPDARSAYQRRVREVSDLTGCRYLERGLDGFEPPRDGFSDYGHMSASGSEAYTRHLAGLLEGREIAGNHPR